MSDFIRFGFGVFALFQTKEVMPSSSTMAPVFLRSPGNWKEQLYLTDYDASFGADFDCTTNSSVILRRGAFLQVCIVFDDRAYASRERLPFFFAASSQTCDV